MLFIDYFFHNYIYYIIIIFDMEKNHCLIPASYLVLIKDNNILLLQRKNTGYEDGNYMFIAGHVEPNESFTGAVIREAKEEAGIIISERDVKLVHMMQRKATSSNNERIDAFFFSIFF